MYTEDDNKPQNNNNEDIKKTPFYDYDSEYSEYEDKALYDEVPNEDDFYQEMKINVQNEGNDDKRLKKVFLIVIVSAILGILGLILAIVFFTKSSNEPEVEIKLLEERVILTIGEEKSISYEVVNAEEDIRATFSSKNPNVVSVDNNGKIKGLREGDSVITISYKSGRKTKEKMFDVIVVKK